MNRQSLTLIALLFTFPPLHAQKPTDWITPTAAELSMTSVPQVPGAAAIYLDKDEVTSTYGNYYTYSARIKVLNDKGKDYANVELPNTVGFEFINIAARTIHPDGKIIPFTGKPYEKLVAKADGFNIKQKLFTLPDVEVGSILEFHYSISDHYFNAPTWYLQSELFTRHQHFLFIPNAAGSFRLKSGEIAPGGWVPIPILPPGLEVKLNKSTFSNSTFELTADNIMPVAVEDFMPPLRSLSYRVMFFATPYKTVRDFWAENGFFWSKSVDEFIGPKKGVSEFAKTLVLPTDSDDQKARKLYAYIMTLENTDFTRQRTAREDKQQGFKQIKSTDDLLKRGRANSDQLALLFVALARAAGLKAYLMGIADRDQHIWQDSYLSFNQMDDYIAILNIAGTEVYFDPGQRYCEPGHLARVHGLSRGLRQSDAGPILTSTRSEASESNNTSRTADLTLDEKGIATGTITSTYTGAAALRWRHIALLGDATSLKDQLRTAMQESLPSGTTVEVLAIDNVAEYTQPFRVKIHIEGPIATSAGKRILIPADIFEVNEKPAFPSPKRETPIDFLYPSLEAHAIRYTLPQTLKVESAPDPETATMAKTAVFTSKTAQTPTSITTYRNLAFVQSYVLPKDYTDLRAFYQKLETKDQETIILTRTTPGSTPSGSNQ
jgi:hypothetical protein